MPRPRRCRRVSGRPAFTYFKPAGIRMTELAEAVLTVDEFEAIRLNDLLGLDQAEAAQKMDISQPTFHRLLISARRKLAGALVQGSAIRIEGGNFQVVRQKGMPMNCICPKCGHKQSKVRGIPCAQTKCEKCESFMIRGD